MLTKHRRPAEELGGIINGGCLKTDTDAPFGATNGIRLGNSPQCCRRELRA